VGGACDRPQSLRRLRQNGHLERRIGAQVAFATDNTEDTEVSLLD